jgi:hypothetical protein
MTIDDQPPTTTEITITGANCPWCFNDTIDLLRAQPGIVDVQATMSGQCLRIEHDGLAVDDLTALVRHHLHAADTSSNEAVMVEIDPHVAALHCSHHPTS